MLNSTQTYSLGICTGVGIALTLLAVAARLGILASDALLDIGCLISGVLLLVVSVAMWLRRKTDADTHLPPHRPSSTPTN